MTSPRLVSANRNPALPDGVPRYAHLFGAQSERRLASCTGPFSPQPLPTTDPFLYGDSCLCPGRHPSWGLCDVTGPSRPSYLHILIHRRDLRWIRFVWQGRAGQGRVFQFWALPFGLSLAPWVFTSHQGASRQVEGHASPRVFGRLADSQDQCHTHVHQLRQLAGRLGFAINGAKSGATPSRTFFFLGINFNTKEHRVR